MCAHINAAPHVLASLLAPLYPQSEIKQTSGDSGEATTPSLKHGKVLQGDALGVGETK